MLEKKEDCDDLRLKIADLLDTKREIREKIESVPAKVINIDNVRENLLYFQEGLDKFLKMHGDGFYKPDLRIFEGEERVFT